METKTQISFAVTAKLISAFVFATQIVQFLYFLNLKFQASSHLLWQYSPVCVGPGRKPRRLVFSERGSNDHECKILHVIEAFVMCDHDIRITPSRCNHNIDFYEEINTFLAHLSRRLIGELIVYPCSVVVVVVVHHFQTSSPLKLLDQSKPNFMWSLLGKGE